MLEFASFVFDPETHELLKNDEIVDLPPTPARLLAFLSARAGHVVPRSAIWEEIWPSERLDLDQRLNYAVYQLRRALGDDAAKPTVIQTFPRRGYRFKPDVRTRVIQGPIQTTPPRPAEALRHGWGRKSGLGSRPWARLAGAGLAALWVVLSLPANPSQPRVQRAGDAIHALPEPSGRSEAREASRIGRHLLDRGGEGDLNRAEAYFWRGVTYDSLYAPAWMGVGLVRDQREDIRVARAMLAVALRLDSTLAYAHLVVGRMAFDESRWEDAEKHLKAAARLDPNAADPHHLLAHLAVVVGNDEGAVSHIEAARKLNPALGLEQGDIGWIYYWAGRFRDALDVCRASEELRGPDRLTQACRLSAHLALGDTGRAAEIAMDIMRSDGGSEPDWETSALPEVVLNRFFEWRLAVLAEIDRADYGRARVAAWLGDSAAALESLEVAADNADRSVLYASAEPAFESLRAHPRFTALMDRLGVTTVALSR